jgi:hypothetical protein
MSSYFYKEYCQSCEIITNGIWHDLGHKGYEWECLNCNKTYKERTMSEKKCSDKHDLIKERKERRAKEKEGEQSVYVAVHELLTRIYEEIPNYDLTARHNGLIEGIVELDYTLAKVFSKAKLSKITED